MAREQEGRGLCSAKLKSTLSLNRMRKQIVFKRKTEDRRVKRRKERKRIIRVLSDQIRSDQMRW